MSPLVSLCMIVRDEEKHLPRCLESVKGLVDEIVIVDTGSRDATIAIARESGAVVKEIKWAEDFAAARNEALNLATGEWVLSMDADEALSPESRAVLPSLLANSTCEGHYVTIQNLQGTAEDGRQPYEVAAAFRLWRNRPLHRFVGSIHEQILPVILAANPEAEVSPSPVTFIHYGYLTETVQEKGKQDRNLRLLQAELARHPENQFLQFCLGGELYLRGQYRDAAATLQRALVKSPVDGSWRPPLVKYYAATLSELGRFREALSVLLPERDRYPDFTDLFYIMGMTYSRLGDHGRAIESFQDCLRLGPAPCPPYWPVDPEVGSCRASAALGRACEAAGRYGEALDAYARAAMAKRGWVEPLKCLTKLMAKRVNEQRMLRVLEAFYPQGTARDQVTIASLLAHAGRYDLALHRLEVLAQEGALDRGGRFTYAFCLAKTDRLSEALAMCEEGWSGSSFEPEVKALRLYCGVAMEADVRPELPGDPEELRILYGNLSSLLGDAPPSLVATFMRRLPRSRMLAKALKHNP